MEQSDCLESFLTAWTESAEHEKIDNTGRPTVRTVRGRPVTTTQYVEQQ